VFCLDYGIDEMKGMPRKRAVAAPKKVASGRKGAKQSLAPRGGRVSKTGVSRGGARTKLNTNTSQCDTRALGLLDPLFEAARALEAGQSVPGGMLAGVDGTGLRSLGAEINASALYKDVPSVPDAVTVPSERHHVDGPGGPPENLAETPTYEERQIAEFMNWKEEDLSEESSGWSTDGSGDGSDSAAWTRDDLSIEPGDIYTWYGGCDVVHGCVYVHPLAMVRFTPLSPLYEGESFRAKRLPLLRRLPRIDPSKDSMRAAIQYAKAAALLAGNLPEASIYEQRLVAPQYTLWEDMLDRLVDVCMRRCGSGAVHRAVQVKRLVGNQALIMSPKILCPQRILVGRSAKDQIEQEWQARRDSSACQPLLGRQSKKIPTRRLHPLLLER
jgi:hypothetical protein